jgi:transcriptional regulator with GAF, ATPase, and Fis domain
MEREELLVETFVTLADTLVADYDVIDFLQVLAERCVDLLEVSAAGIMLADSEGRLRHAACSSEQMRLAELFEVQIEQGPCFDAYRNQKPVSCDSPEDAARRWPQFAPNAAEHGFVTMSAVPLRLRVLTLGALNLFSTQPVKLSENNMRVAQGMADIATIGVLQERAIRDATDLSTQLEGALESRVVIEQAKGILSEHDRISVDEAFARIRTFARSHNRLLGDTARQMIDGSLALGELAPTTTPATAPPHGA